MTLLTNAFKPENYNCEQPKFAGNIGHYTAVSMFTCTSLQALSIPISYITAHVEGCQVRRLQLAGVRKYGRRRCEHGEPVVLKADSSWFV
jgi:hypothetical protein